MWSCESRMRACRRPMDGEQQHPRHLIAENTENVENNSLKLSSASSANSAIERPLVLLGPGGDYRLPAGDDGSRLLIWASTVSGAIIATLAGYALWRWLCR